MDTPRQVQPNAENNRMALASLALMFASVLAFRETAPAETQRARKKTRKGE